ncbi:VOC family protein [Synechococcus sp. M16CYN]
MLAARNLGVLSDFYAKLFGAKPSPGETDHHRVFILNGGLRLDIYRPSRQRPFPRQGRVLSTCLRFPAHATPLSKLRHYVRNALEIGASVLELPQVEVFGAESWIADPEGNAILLLVPNHKSLEPS